MILFILKRIVGSIPTLFAIILLSFMMMRLTPGGPFDSAKAVPAQIEANLKKTYHLDEPLWLQFETYCKGLFHGDFGPSFSNKDFTVTELIYQGFPVSLQLGLSAMAIAIIVGLSFGMIAALYHNRMIDRIVVIFSMTGVVIPNFVIAPLLTFFIGVKLGWLPSGGWGDGHQLSYKILPIITLALPRIGGLARLFRSSMIEVMMLPFMTTARSKGLPYYVILYRHALRSALLPVISYLGPATAGIITGSVVVEQIFSIPGIGRYFVEAAINRDYTLVTGVVIFYGAIIIFLNLMVDMAYGFLDPRVRR